jgi:tRNA-2-methylthio-N6-dimethylallyladenosine synthase
MNDHDMERMRELLIENGLTYVHDAQEADVVVVNTCCVREKAEQKFYSRMGRLRSMKEKRGTILGVTGCIAQLEKKRILLALPTSTKSAKQLRRLQRGSFFLILRRMAAIPRFS